jgi:hypothetical protein
MGRKVVPKSRSLYTDCCVSPDPLSPTLSASLAMKTPYLQSAGPLASLVQTVESPSNKERDPNGPETATDDKWNTTLMDCAAHT